MFMPIEKPNDKGEIRNRVGIMLGLVDRSDEVVVGTTERVVKARTVHRMLAGQRGDATYAKSIRGVLWQPNPARLRGKTVPIEHRLAVPAVDPREHRARRFCIRREVGLVKYGVSDDFE